MCAQMRNAIETLPLGVLDDITLTVFASSPSLRLIFLASLGRCIQSSAVRVLFHSLDVEDDSERFTSRESKLTALFSNPALYAHAVKAIHVKDSDWLDTWQSPYYSRSDKRVIHPLEAAQLSSLLEICANLELMAWTSHILPPEGLCEALSVHNHLSRFLYTPLTPIQSLHDKATRSLQSKWDAPSLLMLSSLSIVSLSLTRLSQSGAQAFLGFLSNMGEGSLLEELTIDFVWLDDPLCEAIAEAGRRLRKLNVGTPGTKLTDRGVSAILEGCDALEDLVLDGVQGRLSRSLWKKPSHYPSGLKRVTTVINELGPHHSWTTDHLLSLHALPMQSLDALFVVRREPPPRLANGVPVYDTVIDDVVALKPVPEEFVERIRDARFLTVFECDWWAWSIADFRRLLESCPNLITIKLCLDAPFVKLLNLPSTFAGMTNLRTLSVSVNPVHAPGKPPTPHIPTQQPSLPTPAESPAVKSKSVLPHLLDIDQIHTHACSTTDATGDPSLPLLRDIKRFVRKCPKLETLHWYGNSGRGSWHITRPTQTLKNTLNVSIEYISPVLSEQVWQALVRKQQGEEILKSGFPPEILERPGPTSIGKVADTFTATDKDRGISTPSRGKGIMRGGHRKVKPSSVTTSWPAEGANDASPRTGELTRSPTRRQFSTPLTPSNSGGSLSPMLQPDSESACGPEEQVMNVRRPVGRKRTPSEPGPHQNGRSNGRSRSATNAMPNSGTFAANGRGLPRSRRGRGAGRGERQFQNGDLRVFM